MQNKIFLIGFLFTILLFGTTLISCDKDGSFLNSDIGTKTNLLEPGDIQLLVLLKQLHSIQI